MPNVPALENAPFFTDVSEGPGDVQAYWVRTTDHLQLRIAHWPGIANNKGTIFLFQGRTENIEKYGRAVSSFEELGYTCIALDWRGQGLSERLNSDRMLGHVGQFSDYQRDVAALVTATKSLDLPQPWFLFGHSLGGCAGLRALLGGFRVAACAFTAPLWDINLPALQRPPAWALSWAAHNLGQGQRYAPGTRGESYVLTTAFEDNKLTNDPDMYQYYVNVSKSLPDQQVGGPSLSWLFGALSEMRALCKEPSPDVPCLTFCGAQDEIVAIPAIQNRMARWSMGQMRLLDGAKHDLLCETPDIRRTVIAEIDQLFSGCRDALA